MERVDGEEPKPVKVITLEVAIEEAEKLAMASNGGEIRLALRSPLNPEIKKTRGATFADLMTSYQLAPKASTRIKVEVIKGKEKSVRRF